MYLRHTVKPLKAFVLQLQTVTKLEVLHFLNQPKPNLLSMQ